MPITSTLESLFKWLFLLSALVTGVAYFYKDKLPDPEYYAASPLEAPKQTPTSEAPFSIRVNEQDYTIEPKFAYELEGVVVSHHDADGFMDSWHKRWKDFINLRDLCVIWGQNVASGVYRNMQFSNDSISCWVSWSDAATGALFQMNALSNNHLLTDNAAIAAALMTAEPGDHIRLKGVLAAYAINGTGFRRGTSTTRDDTGNGACETIYVDEFSIVNKANRKLRRFYSFVKGLTIVSAIGYVIMFMVAPPHYKS